MSIAEVDRYLSGSFKTVEGWCLPHLWQSIQALREAVLRAGGNGPVAEIGVYHGKFFIGLLKTMGAPAMNYAIDVFDLQQFNLDRAGEGNLVKFKENLKAAGVADNTVEIVRADSMWLGRPDMEAMRSRTGGFSMFSVDGCHLAEHTINDMLFAMEVTQPQGIIFVDDYNNPDWPGVQEGVAKFYFHHSARFVPVAYSCNKLMLCSLSFHKTYLESLIAFVRTNFPDTRMKKVKRFGFDTVNVFPNNATGKPLAL